MITDLYQLIAGWTSSGPAAVGHSNMTVNVFRSSDCQCFLKVRLKLPGTENKGAVYDKSVSAVTFSVNVLDEKLSHVRNGRYV